mmetsp:Transcript_44032/g.73354  ORF Transcript_44032/g.73354 Transcript_44032/m.73354 type:complete len:130 (-) Transcript_44032:1428-1817(-)
MCGICGHMRKYEHMKSMVGNKRKRLNACARSLKKILLTLQEPRYLARETLHRILKFEKKNAVRSKKEYNSNEAADPEQTFRWGGLLEVPFAALLQSARNSRGEMCFLQVLVRITESGTTREAALESVLS